MKINLSLPGLLLLLIFLILPGFAGAQVRHNYPVGPQKTTCDSLYLSDNDFTASLDRISHATWRYQQSIHLNRPYGFRRADYYSCDVKTGYLIVEIDTTKYIYMKVPVDLWEELTKSTDPDGFISTKIRDHFSQLK